MANTPSNMLPLGTKAPNFNLRDTISNSMVTFKSIKGKRGAVVMFICNHCPFVLHVNDALVSIAKTYQDKGIGFVAISSNDVENYPQDGPEKMTEHAKSVGYPFPYLYDESQETARAYDAACTPDIYVFDNEDTLIYRGQLDDSRPGNGVPVTGKDLKHALECLLKNEENQKLQKPSIGCNIKWKS